MTRVASVFHVRTRGHVHEVLRHSVQSAAASSGLFILPSCRWTQSDREETSAANLQETRRPSTLQTSHLQHFQQADRAAPSQEKCVGGASERYDWRRRRRCVSCCDTQLVQAVEARSKQSESLIKTWTVGDFLLSLLSSVCSHVLLRLSLIIMNDRLEQFIPTSGASGPTLWIFLIHLFLMAHFASCRVNILLKNIELNCMSC